MIKINLNQTRENIINDIAEYVTSELLNKFPFLQNNCSVTIQGSIATNTFDENSDVDLNIIYSESLDKEDTKKLKEYKQKLTDEGSNIELRLARTYEVLEEYLNWNDDFILGQLHNAIIVYDSNSRLDNLLKKYDWYPPEIFEDKIKWLLSEMSLITHKELGPAIKRNHKYYIEILRMRYLKYFLTTIRLINKEFPVQDKKLYEVTKPLLEDDLVENIDDLVNTSDSKELENIMNQTLNTVIDKVRVDTNINDLEQEKMLTFSTKNKVLFE